MCRAMALVIDRTASAALRHPEKAHRPVSPLLRKPDWIRLRPCLHLAAALASVLAVLLCAACSTVALQPGTRVTITNLQFGPVCGPAYAPTSVCAQSSDIDATGHGRCIYDRRPIDCTWYGYSFDYTSPEGATFLDCDWSSNYPTALGNPRGVQEQAVTSSHLRLPLPSHAGHIFNPQYAGVGRHDAVETIVESCAYKGEKLFQIEFRLHYPQQKSS